MELVHEPIASLDDLPLKTLPRNSRTGKGTMRKGTMLNPENKTGG